MDEHLLVPGLFLFLIGAAFGVFGLYAYLTCSDLPAVWCIEQGFYLGGPSLGFVLLVGLVGWAAALLSVNLIVVGLLRTR